MGVLATVGERAITESDLRAEAAHRIERGRPVADKDALLRELVTRAALLERARRTGLGEDPEVRRELESLLIGKLWEREVGPQLRDLEVTPGEMRAAYEAALDEYTQPAKVRLALLFLPVRKGMSEARRAEQRARIEEARRRVIENPPPGGRGPAARGFGALAIEYSDEATSRYRGGDIGWLEPGCFEYRWPRAVLEAGYAAAVGEVSDVIETADGLYLVKKTDAREPRVTPFGDVRAAIRQRLLAEKQRRAGTAFRAESVRLAGVVTNAEALLAVSLPIGEPVAAGGEAPPAGPVAAGSVRRN